MKKRNIWKWIISLMVVLFLITLAIFVPKMIEEHIKMEVKTEQESAHDKLVKIATSEKANKVYRQGLKNIDKNAFTPNGVIKHYKIEKNSVSHNPMGGIDVKLTINNDNKLTVLTTLDSYDDGHTLEGGAGGYSKKLDDLVEKNNE